jgi:hypothetical protein
MPEKRGVARAFAVAEMRMKPALFLAAVVLGGSAVSAQAAPAAASSPNPEKLASARKVVDEGWRLYDDNDDDALSPLEFGTWVMRAQGRIPARSGRRGRAKGPSPAAILNATSAAFTRADADGNRAISRDELVAFLAS